VSARSEIASDVNYSVKRWYFGHALLQGRTARDRQ